MSYADTSLFILSRPSSIIYFLVYVDDLIITSNNSQAVDQIIQQLSSTFSVKDLGMLSFFCGVEVCPTTDGLVLSQHKFVVDLLQKHHMVDSKPVFMPLPTGTSLTLHDGALPLNATMYRQVVGGLQHLQITRPRYLLCNE